MSNVRKILCHAEFLCARCGMPFLCMAVAPWEDGTGVTGDGVSCGRDICNDCDRADRDEEREAYNKAQRQKDWVRRHTVEGRR